MKTAKLFQNGHSQAVRLPKEFQFPGTKVYIKQVGNATILFSVENPWEPLFESIQEFSEDFMVSREQPKQQERENF